MTPVTLTRANFDDAVLRASATRPVLVDFWAPWCAPCRALAPVLDRLAAEYAGRFTLAKLNTEDEPELAARYGVRGIPNCKLFVDGAVVDEFTGALPESALRDFLAAALPSPAAPLVADAKVLLAAGDAAGALARLDDALALDPADEDALLTRLEALLALNRAAEAKSRRRGSRRRGGGCATSGGWRRSRRARRSLPRGPPTSPRWRARRPPRPSTARRSSLTRGRWPRAGDYERALAELLAIVRTDRAFGDDAGRRTMLTVFEALPADSDLTRRYRRELAAAIN